MNEWTLDCVTEKNKLNMKPLSDICIFSLSFSVSYLKLFFLYIFWNLLNIFYAFGEILLCYVIGMIMMTVKLSWV